MTAALGWQSNSPGGRGPGCTSPTPGITWLRVLATITEYIAQMVRDRGHQVSLLYGGHGLYEPYPASLAGLVGQDAITLAVGLPLLLASMWLTARGSTSGLLLWIGALFYFSYYFYVIGDFNAIFLLYVAIVSTSLYGMLSLLFAIDPVALKACFGARTPTRLVGGFLIGYSLLLLNGR